MKLIKESTREEFSRELTFMTHQYLVRHGYISGDNAEYISEENIVISDDVFEKIKQIDSADDSYISADGFCDSIKFFEKLISQKKQVLEKIEQNKNEILQADEEIKKIQTKIEEQLYRKDFLLGYLKKAYEYWAETNDESEIVKTKTRINNIENDIVNLRTFYTPWTDKLAEILSRCGLEDNIAKHHSLRYDFQKIVRNINREIEEHKDDIQLRNRWLIEAENYYFSLNRLSRIWLALTEENPC